MNNRRRDSFMYSGDLRVLSGLDQCGTSVTASTRLIWRLSRDAVM